MRSNFLTILLMVFSRLLQSRHSDRVLATTRGSVAQRSGRCQISAVRLGRSVRRRWKTLFYQVSNVIITIYNSKMYWYNIRGPRSYRPLTAGAPNHYIGIVFRYIPR